MSSSFYFRIKDGTYHFAGKNVTLVELNPKDDITREVWDKAVAKGNDIMCFQRGKTDLLWASSKTDFKFIDQEEHCHGPPFIEIRKELTLEELKLKIKLLEDAIHFYVQECPICGKNGACQVKCRTSRFRCGNGHLWWRSTGEILSHDDPKSRPAENPNHASLAQVSLFLEQVSEILSEPFDGLPCKSVKRPGFMKTYLEKTIKTLKTINDTDLFMNTIRKAKNECIQFQSQ